MPWRRRIAPEPAGGTTDPVTQISMLQLALKNLLRRPLRTALTTAGLAVSLAALSCLLAFGEGYTRGLGNELNRMGMQLMLVPLGCPYDAAARVLKGRALDVSLPAEALEAVRADPAVAVAAPIYTAALPRPDEGRTDLWVGIDQASLALRPWWKLTDGSTWFEGPDSVILGAEAAETEMRRPGDRLYSPETGKELRVCGVLERSGTSDDSLFFVPLATAQALFKEPGRLTGIAIRLRDPSLTAEASERLQAIPGAQVVTLTEMMGTFLNLVGSARTLVLAVAAVALAVGALGVFNTMTASLLERTGELAVMRAVGMSRGGAFGLMALESLLLAAAGALAGAALALALGGAAARLARPFLPLGPDAGLPALTPASALVALGLALAVGLLAGLVPAWRASRLRPGQALRAAE
jgi:putative ABC transport system permease protein